jgi:hypothetical protein
MERRFGAAERNDIIGLTCCGKARSGGFMSPRGYRKPSVCGDGKSLLRAPNPVFRSRVVDWR